MNKEESVIIPDHQSYRIDFSGNIEREDGRHPLIYETPDRHGIKYKRVQLDDKVYYVHRLVAETFIDNSEDKAFVDHIDHDILNNHISNLRWVTEAESTYNQRGNVKKRKHKLPKNVYVDCNNPDKFRVAFSINNKFVQVAQSIDSLITAIMIARRGRLLFRGEYRCE